MDHDGRRLPRWVTSLLATLGILAMAAAMWFSSRYEAGLNGAVRPCERWATPCTPDQVTAMLRRTEWLWLGGAGLLLASLAGSVLARIHTDLDLQVHGTRPLARRLLTVALFGLPVYVIGVVASSLLGSLAPFTACALVLAAMIALAARLGCEVRVPRRLLAIGLMSAVVLLAVPWMRQVGGLAERNSGASWANVVGMFGWLGAWLLPAAGALLATRLLGSSVLRRSEV
ncbi:MAG: hypothetical protein L0G49_00345 [Luteococcus sp.]|uniref:hypothetical protein n=1 Tax=Luteococcus sp. TaxID=1969402 RepID=UPI002649EAA8|nr:hypothetical protein [Luteococcus sp.]MDN5562225.1 hypothetical protein [Luteococcus sp.]